MTDGTKAAPWIDQVTINLGCLKVKVAQALPASTYANTTERWCHISPIGGAAEGEDLCAREPWAGINTVRTH